MLFGMNFVFLAVLNNQDGHTPHPIGCLYLMCAFPFVSIFLSIFVKEDLRRLNAAKMKAVEA